MTLQGQVSDRDPWCTHSPRKKNKNSSKTQATGVLESTSQDRETKKKQTIINKTGQKRPFTVHT